MEDTEEWKYEQGRPPSSPSWYRNSGEEDMVEEKGQKEEELADRDTQQYLSTGLYRQGSKGGV